jgi:hypothetical protein
MARGADTQFELLPLGWQRIEVPLSKALDHEILSAEIAQLYPIKADRPPQVGVYRFYNQPADTTCIDWRNYQFIPALMDTRSPTIHRPKGAKHLFWCYNCVMVSKPDSNLLEESKKALDWNILRQNNIKRIMYIAGFKYFINLQDITVASLDESTYESVTRVCTQICGSGLTKKEVTSMFFGILALSFTGDSAL